MSAVGGVVFLTVVVTKVPLSDQRNSDHPSVHPAICLICLIRLIRLICLPLFPFHRRPLLALPRYKFFGPHVGVLYGKTQWMDALQSFRVRPASNELPTPTNYEISKWEMGTQNYEGLVGSTAAVDYLASISEGRGVVRGGGGGGGEGEDEEDVSRRGRIEAGWAMVGEHEDAMARRFLGGLESIPGVELYGIDGVGDDSGGEHGVAKRTATFSLTKEGLSPDELAFQLVDRGIHAASGNFYALAFSEALGLEAQGGLTRVGFLHYNNSEDVDRTLEALEAAKVDGEREQRVGPKGY